MAHRFNPKRLSIRLTFHALRRGILRGVTELEIEDLVHNGTRRIEQGKGERGGDIWVFYKEIKGRRLAAVTEILHSDCYVLTVKNA
jgi:hypothetical protein